MNFDNLTSDERKTYMTWAKELVLWISGQIKKIVRYLRRRFCKFKKYGLKWYDDELSRLDRQLPDEQNRKMLLDTVRGKLLRIAQQEVGLLRADGEYKKAKNLFYTAVNALNKTGEIYNVAQRYQNNIYQFADSIGNLLERFQIEYDKIKAQKSEKKPELTAAEILRQNADAAAHAPVRGVSKYSRN